MKVALLYNEKPEVAGAALGRYASDQYAEWDNPETIAAVAEALRRGQHEVVMIDCHPARIVEIIQTLQQTKPDICFNIAEGAGALSREAQMPALCDLLGIKYTASDVMTLAITLDKARTKEILHYNHVPTPDFEVVETLSQLPGALSKTWILETLDAGKPVIIKPLHEGSSKGIFERSVVSSVAEAEAQVHEVLTVYRQPALIEVFLSGREFTVAMLGNGEDAEVLPIVELSFDHLPAGSKKIYSYEAKWLWDEPENPVEVFKCPAPLEPPLKENIERICKAAYRVLRCRDWSRIDVRLDAEGKPFVIEVNPLPGILPNPDEHSCFPMAARMAGMDYNQLINRVLDEALKRHGLA
ncbi:MAG: ATP-grasp domain-containing protein [Rhizobacter sp.]|nr:ATP-grasp domain-containing protein [Chlorobiales bacterium]